MDWFELLERFQDAVATSVAAILGFGGIILTIRSNAKLALRERQEAKKQEHQSLLAALHSELDVFRSRLENHISALDELQHGETMYRFGMGDAHPIFDACLSNLGLMGRETIMKLVVAYFYWDRMPNIIQSVIDTKSEVRAKRRFLPDEHIEEYKAIIRSTHAALLPALDALDREAKQIES